MILYQTHKLIATISCGFLPIASKKTHRSFNLCCYHLVISINVTLHTDDIIFKPEPHVKLLRVFLNDKLSFMISQHVSISFTKAARQLNALARIARYLNISLCSLLYNSFVRSNLTASHYCGLVWHFYGKKYHNGKKSKNGPWEYFREIMEILTKTSHQQLKPQDCW